MEIFWKYIKIPLFRIRFLFLFYSYHYYYYKITLYQRFERNFAWRSNSCYSSIFKWSGSTKEISNDISNVIKSFPNERSDSYLDKYLLLRKTLETETSLPAQWSQLRGLVTKYYSSVSIRVYYLYEILGVDQIQRVKHISLKNLYQLPSHVYWSLVNEAMDIWAGAQNLEEENWSCNPWLH